MAQRAAEAELVKLRARARKAIESERDATVERMRLSLTHQGLEAGAVLTRRLVDGAASTLDLALRGRVDPPLRH
jgi:hypothetical protein